MSHKHTFPLPGGREWIVLAYEYPDAEAARLDWERIEEESRGKKKNFSVWRTTTPDYLQWFVIVCGEEEHLPETRGGTLVHLDYEMAKSFVIRRARTGADAFAENPDEHFEHRARYGDHPVTIDPQTGGVKPYIDE